MAEQLSLWSHALAALLLAAVCLWTVRRAPHGLPRWPLVAMLGIGAAWALAVAGVGAGDPATRLLSGLRDLSILGLMVALHRNSGARPLGIAPVYGVVALVIVSVTLLQLVAIALGVRGVGLPVATAATLLRMMVAVAALVLVHNLAITNGRGVVRMLCLAIAGLWIADLGVATAAYLTGHWPPEMMAARGVVTRSRYRGWSPINRCRWSRSAAISRCSRSAPAPCRRSAANMLACCRPRSCSARRPPY